MPSYHTEMFVRTKERPTGARIETVSRQLVHRFGPDHFHVESGGCCLTMIPAFVFDRDTCAFSDSRETKDFAVWPRVGETLVEVNLDCESFHRAPDSVTWFGVELARDLEQEFDGAEVWITEFNSSVNIGPRPWHFNREEQDALLAACKERLNTQRRAAEQES